ncbi:MAG TPA: sulfite exporter TauE/SafE family protein [Actinomycetota bacterium]|nr:sulfite exporter TauE/SafE family protein [Actinomycetota bacterium]
MVWVWLGVFGVVALASAAQAVSGFGFALIGAPLVAVLVGPKEAVVGLAMIGLVLVAQLSLRGRGHVDRPTVGVVTAAAIVGMPLGLVVLVLANDRALTLAIAIAVIAFSLLLWRGARVPAGRRTDAAAGFTAGILSTSTGTSGPPIVIALSAKQLEPAAFRATISAIFLVQGSVSLVAFAIGGQITRDAVAVALAGLPGVIIGSIVGERGFRRLDTPKFRRVVLGMLFLSGAVALFGALWP